MQYERIDADFLIIGGGSAGCMAAIRALESNPKLKDFLPPIFYFLSLISFVP